MLHSTTLDDGELDRLKGSCREYSLPRSDPSERMELWKHEDRSSSGCDCLLSSRPLWSGDHDHLSIWRWNSFMGEDCECRNIRNGSVGVRRHLFRRSHYRIISGNGSTLKQESSTRAVSKVLKQMTRLLGHDQTVPREEDGAVELRILASIFSFNFHVLSVLVNSDMAKPSFRASPGHFGRKHMNFTLQDNVLLPSDFAEHIYHVGSYHEMHSIIQSGMIPRGKDVTKGRHAVFFTAVNPMLREEAQDCSVRTQLENTPKHNVFV